MPKDFTYDTFEDNFENKCKFCKYLMEFFRFISDQHFYIFSRKCSGLNNMTKNSQDRLGCYVA